MLQQFILYPCSLTWNTIFNVAADLEGVMHHQQQKTNKTKRCSSPGKMNSLPYKNKPRGGNHTACAHFYFVYFYANQAVAGEFVVNSRTD